MKIRLFGFAALPAVTAALILAACAPIVPPTAGGSSDETSAAQEGTASESTAEETDGAMATVATRSLRVRQAPNADAEMVYGLREGESYQVLAISGDGQWLELAIPQAPGGSGWVSANLVTVEGEVTGLGNGETAGESLLPTPTPEPEAEGETAASVDALPVPTPLPGFAAVVTDGTRLRVRSEPTTDAPIVGYIYNGESYPVLETSADGLWIKIGPAAAEPSDNPAGGWVAAEFLLIGQ